jgi:hypothetical protein
MPWCRAGRPEKHDRLGAVSSPIAAPRRRRQNAVSRRGRYAFALAVVAGVVAVVIVVLTALGSEARGVAFGTGLRPDTAVRPIPKAG